MASFTTIIVEHSIVDTHITSVATTAASHPITGSNTIALANNKNNNINNLPTSVNIVDSTTTDTATMRSSITRSKSKSLIRSCFTI
jgi:hypothetical protein